MITKHLINVMLKACFKTSIIDTPKMHLKKSDYFWTVVYKCIIFIKIPHVISDIIYRGKSIMTSWHGYILRITGPLCVGVSSEGLLKSWPWRLSTTPREISILTTGAPLIRTAPPRTKWQADISTKKQTMHVGAVQGMEWLRALMTLKCQTCMGIQWYWGCSWQEVTDVTVTSHQW